MAWMNYRDYSASLRRNSQEDHTAALKGAVVVVARGRKVPKGTTGRVFWTGTDSWGNGRLGLKDKDGTVHWTAAKNVDVLEKAGEGAPEAPFVPAPGFHKGASVVTEAGEGEVFWVGPDKRNPGGTRLGVKLSTGTTMWTSVTEVNLVNEKAA